MSRLIVFPLTLLAFVPGPLLAQPGGTPARPTAVTAQPVPPAPVPGPAPAPVPPSPAPVPGQPATPPPEAPEVNVASPVVNQNAAPRQPAPAEPDTINIAANYPNGFADPEFDNVSRADNDRDGGFPWGLLGLLGLLGLVPWIRGTGPKTIYVEREKPGEGPTRPRE